MIKQTAVLGILFVLHDHHKIKTMKTRIFMLSTCYLINLMTSCNFSNLHVTKVL